MADIHWSSVAVAWALSLATWMIVYGVIKVVVRVRRRAAKRRHFMRGVEQCEKPVGVTVPSRLSTSTVKSELSWSSSSGSRRTTDEVTQWCNKYNLPEALVYELRERKFTTTQALDSLKASDVPAMNLSNQALAVQLRQVLETVRSPDNISTKRQTSEVRPLLKSSSSESPPLSDKNSTVFDDVVDGIHKPCSGRLHSQSSSGAGTANEVIFQGMLSDSGLHRLAGRLGNEWQHLATELGIPQRRVDRMIANHPHSVEGAIYEMLHLWRQKAVGDKSEIKGQLFEALQAVERNDLAQELQREAVNGSCRKPRVRNIRVL